MADYRTPSPLAREAMAYVLAGGRGTRLGGVDKPALVRGDRTLLAIALDAVDDARRIAVVRAVEDVPLSWRVSRVVVGPQGGGPAAAIEAGRAELARWPAIGRRADFVVVIAADLARGDEALAVLRDISVSPRRDGVVAVDPSGHDQPLLAIYRTEALRASIERNHPVAGLSMRRLIAGLDLRRTPLPAELCADVDTPADAERVRALLPPGPVRDLLDHRVPA